MPSFLVEVYAPKATGLMDFASAGRAAAELSMGESGRVRYLDSILVPEDETCFHLFEGPSAAAVSEAARRAALPFQRVVEAVRPPRLRTAERRAGTAIEPGREPPANRQRSRSSSRRRAKESP